VAIKLKYSINRTHSFKKDFKLIKRQNKDISKLTNIISRLAEGVKLEEQHHDHKLKGKYNDCYECHIEPDWLLVYRIEGDRLDLIRTGSHSDLFR